MKLCPSEADFRPVSGRVHHVSDQFLIGIEGCRYKDQASLFPTHHDDSGWCGCSSNHGVYCGYYGQYGDCLSHTASMLWGDWRVCTFELPWLFFGKEIAFSKTYPSFLTLKEGSTFLTKPLFNGLYAPFGSPSSGGQKPSGTRECSWLCYSAARVLVSQRSLCPQGAGWECLRNRVAIVCRLAHCGIC